MNHFQRRTKRLHEEYIRKINGKKKTKEKTKEKTVDIEQYAVGGGWYKLPGHEKSLRKDKAIEALKKG